MALIRSGLGRFITAIGIGLTVEILLLAGGTLLGSRFQPPWDERVWAATQAPAYYVIDWVARARQHGFEERGAFFVLIPLTQWLIWSTVSYLFLAREKGNAVPIE